MRSKEQAHDYRYFPDPDLLPVELTPDFIDTIRSSLPELPWEKRSRFQKDYQLNTYDANLLAMSRETADYFESVLQNSDNSCSKIAANWINGELSAALNKENLNLHQSPVSPAQLGGLIKRVADGTITNNIAKQVFAAIWQGEPDADTVIEKQGLKQITDSSAIESVIDEIILANPEQVAQFRSGKDKLFAFFVGKVMQATRGKANPQQVNDLLKKKL